MTDDFATAMRRALQSTRAGDPAAATAAIQAALSGQPRPCPDTGHAPEREAQARGRSSLRETLARMQAQGLRPAGTGMARNTARASVPAGGRVETRTFTCGAGSRDYRLFVPAARPGGIAGVVLMLHGCTQTPEDFAAGTAMDHAAAKAGYVVVYPGQSAQANPQGCWNWFRPADQVPSGGEAEILGGLAREIAEEFGAKDRVYAAGLSAGGAMAAILAETHGDLFAAVGIHSGLPAGAASDMPSAFAAMRGERRAGRPVRGPAIVFHGMADATVAPSNADAILPCSGVETSHRGNGRAWSVCQNAEGSELWRVEGAGHAWFGGTAEGSHADPSGPDASAEMLRFFGGIGGRT